MPNAAPFNFMGKTACNLLGLFDPEDEGNTLPRNIGNYLPVDRTKQPRRPVCIKHELDVSLTVHRR